MERTLAGKTSKQSAKAAKKAVSKRAATKKTAPATAAAKSRKTAKPPSDTPHKTAAPAPAKPAPARSATPNGAAGRSKAAAAAKRPALLSGGNPQIPKGDGDAPVQAYIAAMPGWKSAIGRRLDALIARTVPGVHKAVKWNSPFYGTEEGSWFLSYHCFAKYIKVAFFRGASLRPAPSVESKHKQVRYLHIHEDEPLDEAQFTDWVKQASKLPGERM
jgi:hypothetical protein